MILLGVSVSTVQQDHSQITRVGGQRYDDPAGHLRMILLGVSVSTVQQDYVQPVHSVGVNATTIQQDIFG
jgi:hypothetical protein